MVNVRRNVLAELCYRCAFVRVKDELAQRVCAEQVTQSYRFSGTRNRKISIIGVS